jgi:hypothetical protein
MMEEALAVAGLLMASGRRIRILETHLAQQDGRKVR